jgi:DNA-directed RNA polymerase subunit RPC12/RpoP
LFPNQTPLANYLDILKLWPSTSMPLRDKPLARVAGHAQILTIQDSIVISRETKKTGRMTSYTVDLAKVKRKESINCPKCGTEISPDDETEETFSILEPVVKGEHLESVVLQCNRCKSRILMTGFQLLQDSTDNAR